MEVLGHKIQQAVNTNKWQPYKIGKDGLAVSHIFFADDLLLFGEASIQQAIVMFEIIQTFYGESGQRVNGRKSKIWYAPKTPLGVIQAISRTFDIPTTHDLGKYLGVPLIHGRIRPPQFDYLLDKVKG